ncbi:MAG: VOC family protein [Clostridia bacterium]|nr:VOC family protein [Clostridia bacterium]
MELYSTYIETDKFEEVVKFYEQILQLKPNIYTKDRWVEFNIGNKLAIYNKVYDEEKIKSGNLQDNFNSEYIKNFNIDRGEKKNNIITLNFYAENLKEEYKRIKELNICKMSEIMYVNITEPYYYFNIYDPEGNTIEICSNSLK